MQVLRVQPYQGAPEEPPWSLPQCSIQLAWAVPAVEMMLPLASARAAMLTAAARPLESLSKVRTP
ncbi:hypothetical protein CG740_34900 [Streptomyces sp. CB01201]|nr:hypothetical protein CG740_34900 [Streptomyces sp. CB01201]